MALNVEVAEGSIILKAIKFEGANIEFAKDQEQYNTLPACAVRDKQGTVISCYELTDEEIEKLKKTKRIYLTLLTFNDPLQPQLLTVDNPVPDYFPEHKKEFNSDDYEKLQNME